MSGTNQSRTRAISGISLIIKISLKIFKPARTL